MFVTAPVLLDVCDAEIDELLPLPLMLLLTIVCEPIDWIEMLAPTPPNKPRLADSTEPAISELAVCELADSLEPPTEMPPGVVPHIDEDDALEDDCAQAAPDARAAPPPITMQNTDLRSRILVPAFYHALYLTNFE